MRASDRQKNTVLPAVMVVAGLITAALLSGYIQIVRPQLPENYEDSDLTVNGARLKGFALGFDSLIADWYWMRSLQYIGNKIVASKSEDIDLDDLRSLNPRLLHPLLENATDMDPHFTAAFAYGAVVLPAIDPEKAIAIAQKGIANNPNEWRLYQHLGYIYWKLKQYDKAAETYDRGSEIPGAAPFMKIMAAAMRTEGGSRSTARQIYQAMLDGSDDPMVRVTAERRLNLLASLDEREAIDRALAEHKEKTGRCVTDLKETIPLLMPVKLPEGREFRIDSKNRLVDPTGAPYGLDRDKCRVILDEETGLPKS